MKIVIKVLAITGGILLLFLATTYGLAVYGGQPANHLGSDTFQYAKAGIDRLFSWGSGTSNESISGRVEDLYQLTNEIRTDYQLPLFQEDPFLDYLAQQHAEDLYARDAVDHLGYDTRSQSALQMGYDITAENVAGGGYGASSFIEMWMNSPGHRANILDASLTHVGIGIFGKYAVIFFAG